MNRAEFDKNAQNPWKDRDALHKVSPVYTLGSVIVFFLCALGLTVCRQESVSIGLMVLSLAYVVWIARRPSVTIGLLLTTLLFTTIGSELIVGAVFLALVVGTMSGAFLLTTRRIPIIVILLIPIAAAGAAYAITRNVEISLLALSFAPASAFLAIATQKNAWRTKALLACMGGFLLIIAACVVYLIWKTTGGISRGCVVQFVDTVRNAIVDFLLQQREELLRILSEQVADAQTAGLTAQIEAVLAPDAIRTTVAEMFNSLPAVITVATSLLAFFAQMLLTAAYAAVGLEKVLNVKARMLTVSVTGAVLFLVGFILVLLLPDSLALATALNLSIILLPIFFLCGVQSILSIAQSSPGARVFILFIMGALFCCYSGGMLYMLAIFGAYSRISSAISQKLMKRANSNGGDS